MFQLHVCKTNYSLSTALLPRDKYRFAYYCLIVSIKCAMCHAMITSKGSVIEIDLICMIHLKLGLIGQKSIGISFDDELQSSFKHIQCIVYDDYASK